MLTSDYELAEACIDVFGQITEADYRIVEEILGEPLGRFKGWSTHYVFTADTLAKIEVIAAHCRSRGLAHHVSIETRWVATAPQPVTATVEAVERWRRRMSTLYPGAAPKDVA